MRQLELAAFKAGKSISKDETKSLVMSMGHRLTAVIVRKGSATVLTPQPTEQLCPNYSNTYGGLCIYTPLYGKL